jgi:hypothetical protein
LEVGTGFLEKHPSDEIMSPLKFLNFLIQIEVGSWDWILGKTSDTRFCSELVGYCF